MRSIRQLGAHVIAGRRQGLLGRQAWARLSAAYEEFRTPGGLPVSHDVIYLSAQKE
jgi:malonyl-CoA O-methyltransferase